MEPSWGQRVEKNFCAHVFVKLRMVIKWIIHWTFTWKVGVWNLYDNEKSDIFFGYHYYYYLTADLTKVKSNLLSFVFLEFHSFYESCSICAFIWKPTQKWAVKQQSAVKFRLHFYWANVTTVLARQVHLLKKRRGHVTRTFKLLNTDKPLVLYKKVSGHNVSSISKFDHF